MKIYSIRGNAYPHGYIERIERIEVVEKKLSYVGQGRRIKKSEIGEVTEGTVWGAYKCFVTDENDIQNARVLVKDKVIQYRKNKINTLKRELENTETELKLALKFGFKDFQIEDYTENRFQ